MFLITRGANLEMVAFVYLFFW